MGSQQCDSCYMLGVGRGDEEGRQERGEKGVLHEDCSGYPYKGHPEIKTPL